MLRKIGNRIATMRTVIIEICGKRTGFRVAVPVSQLGFKDARSAGAQKKADTFCAVAFACGFYRCYEIVLLKAKLRQSIVAAIISRKVGAHRAVFETIDSSDISIQIDIEEIARDQPGLSGVQSVKCGFSSFT